MQYMQTALRRITTYTILTLLVAHAATAASAPEHAPVSLPTAKTSGTIPGLGTNIPVFDLGTYNPNAPTSLTNNWYIPGRNLKTPVGLASTDQALLNQQLQQIRSSGQDMVSVLISLADLATCEANGQCDDGYPDGVWGEVLDYSGFALRAEQRENLRWVSRRVKELGFRYWIVRFGSSVASAQSWDEVAYQKTWNLIYDARGVINGELDGSATKLLIDLGAEGAGAFGYSPVIQQFVSRLWADYTTAFGHGDTVGFSFAVDASLPQRFAAQLAWLGSTKPPVWAFDIYGDVAAGLALIQSAMGAHAGEPIIILETYHNDPATRDQVSSALATHPGLNVIGLLQWPLLRTPAPCVGCDTHLSAAAVAALTSSSQVSNYLPLTSALAVENSNPSLLSLTNVNCTGAAYPCTVQGAFGYAPAPGAPVYVVTVKINDGARVIWGCDATPGSGLATWVMPDVTYLFEYFRTSSCTQPIPAWQTPVAKSYVSAR